jgi:hypothetical protein
MPATEIRPHFNRPDNVDLMADDNSPSFQRFQADDAAQALRQTD